MNSVSPSQGMARGKDDKSVMCLEAGNIAQSTGSGGGVGESLASSMCGNWNTAQPEGFGVAHGCLVTKIDASHRP